MITKSEAIKVMTDNGFVVADNDERYAKIADGRELVGILLDDRAILYIDAGYKNSVDLWYNKRDVKKKLKEAISLVKQRYERFESEKRKLRVDTVRKYFQERKDAQTMLSQPTYDYEKLCRQLTKQSTAEILQ